jgi:hypothetical protein
VRQIGGQPVPHYMLTVGGGVDGTTTHFGRLVGRIPARRVPEAVARLLVLYAAKRQDGESARQFLRRAEIAELRATLADLAALEAAAARPEDLVDLGADASSDPPPAAATAGA